MNQPIVAQGQGGTVMFDGHFVTITRKGLGRLVVGKGEKRIPLRSITAVQLKPAGPLVNGFIQFSMSGGEERRSQFGRQTFDAAGDENSGVFYRKQQPAFEQLRAAIEQAICGKFSAAGLWPTSGLPVPTAGAGRAGRAVAAA
jgi:uncharacterized protein DUF4429